MAGALKAAERAMDGLFFTGTDTGVGKTVVTAAVARLLRRQGRSCRVSKPVATGARLIDGSLVSEDTFRLGRASGETAAMPEPSLAPASPSAMAPAPDSPQTQIPATASSQRLLTAPGQSKQTTEAQS